MKLTKVSTIVIAAAMMVSAAGCSTASKLGLAAAGETAMSGLMLTNDQLVAAVGQSVAQMDAQNKVAPANSKYTQRLNKLTQGLTNLEGLPLNFKVYETNEINAFACPDGSVRVYTGIMDLMDDEELLGIIGHEIGHVAMQHSLNAYKQQILQNALFQALGSLNGTTNAVLNSAIGELGVGLFQKGTLAKYSRKQENEADDFGYDFLKGSSHNPYAMVQAFQKMQKLEQNAQTNAQMSGYMQNMFSSHPETSERIRRMTERCKADGYIK